MPLLLCSEGLFGEHRRADVEQFVAAQPGFATHELEPWTESGESWRRLQITFPDHIHTHCNEQILYIDNSGLVASRSCCPPACG
jgi:hypothetical protein